MYLLCENGNKRPSLKPAFFPSLPGRLVQLRLLVSLSVLFFVSRARLPVHAVHVCGYMHGPIRDHSSGGVIVAPLELVLWGSTWLRPGAPPSVHLPAMTGDPTQPPPTWATLPPPPPGETK